MGEPEQAANLTPTIEDVQVVRNSEGEPVNLLVIGTNHMIFYKFSYSTIDGQFAWGHGSDVLETENGLVWHTTIHIPNPDTFDAQTQHTITYYSPFGAVFRQFEVTPELSPPCGDGECDDNHETTQITICHIPPGHPENHKTLTIDESDLAGHLGHGDTLGACETEGKKGKNK